MSTARRLHHRRFHGPPVMAFGALLVVLGLAVPGLLASPAYADSVRRSQWYLDYLGIPEAHRLSEGKGVTVAVLDTGVDADHPDLKGNVVAGADGFDPDGKGWEDPHDHGTQMASLVAGHGHGKGGRDGILGIAPKAKIMPVTVVAPGERGAGRTAIGQGIEWATDHGADIILVALSGGPGQGEAEAISYAKSKDVLVIAAAGNKSRYGGGSMVGYPAGHEGVLAVSAVDRHGKFASFSASGDKVGLAAPGVDIRTASANGGYATGDGTSHAAAVVAGLAALVKARYGAENEDDLAVRLGGTATDKGPEGRDTKYGLGIPDVVKALSVSKPPYAPTSSGPATSPPPTRDPAAAKPEPTGMAPRTVGMISGFLVVLVLGALLTAGVAWRLVRRSTVAAGTVPPGAPGGGGDPPPGTPGAGPAQGSTPPEPTPPDQAAPESGTPDQEPPPDVWKRPDNP